MSARPRKGSVRKVVKLEKNGIKKSINIGQWLSEQNATSSGADKYCPPPLHPSPLAPHAPQQRQPQPPIAQLLYTSDADPSFDHEPLSDEEIGVDGDAGGRPSSTSTQPPPAYPLDSIRPEMHESFLINIQQARQDHEAMNALYTAKLQAKLKNVTCSTCCSTATFQCSSGSTVRVISPLGVNILEVPHMKCNSPACGSQYYPRPTQIGCLPGTANAWQLQRVDDIPVLWFHYSVLEEMDQLVYKCKRLSTTGYVDALAHRWPGGISDCGLSAYTLREQIIAAVNEYRFADTHMKTLPEALPGWPVGLLACCLSCYQQAHGAAGQAIRWLHTLHFDLCFKLALFQKRNLSLAYPAPPNRKLFTDNAAVQTFLQQCDQQQGNAAAEGHGATGGATDSCSSFKADKVVAQAYSKVG